MNLFIIIRVAYRALGRNKMRSVLTMLGIIIGVAAVIAMVSIGQGARSSVQAQIASLGTNVLMVFPDHTTQSGVRGGMGTLANLLEDDAKAIAEECPSVAAVSPQVRTSTQVVFGDQNWNTGVQGVSPEFVQIRDWPIESGSFFTDSDVRGAAKVAVLGKTVTDYLFGGQDPIGQIVRIKKLPFKVVGVLARKGGAASGADQDDIVIVPYTSAQKKLLGHRHFGIILVSAVNRNLIPQAQQEITDLLRQRHRIPSDADDDFTIRSQSDIAATAEATSKVMTILLGSIASVSLLVGGIGIMNIMLVSVTERIREIGIRMAVGARGRDILFQFLVEAVVLSTFGGILGILLGMVSSKVISSLAHWPTLIAANSVLLAFLFSGIVGIFFGFYPAQKAARLDPIEALRYE